MVYLKTFKLKREYRGMQPFDLAFRDLNIIVGENGSGKSSLIHLLTEYESNKEIAEVKHDPCDYMFLDTEKHNPRTRRDSDYLPGSVYGYSLHSHFVSHGESMLPIILLLEKLAGKVIFIDEPEAGISLSNQQKILETLLKAAKKCQIVVTTHSYPIIKEAGEVFSLDHKKWMPSKKYLEHIKII